MKQKPIASVLMGGLVIFSLSLLDSRCGLQSKRGNPRSGMSEAGANLSTPFLGSSPRVQIELAKGDEVVAEPERGRPLVLKRNPNGDVRTEVLADQLEAPQGVVLLLGQNVSVFVAEAAAGRITRITPAEGGMKKETVRSELNAPVGLAIDSCSGDLLVTTVGDGRLLRLSRDGSRLQVLAEGLKGPMGVTVSQDGAIVVAESLAGRLIRISPDGSDRVSLVQGLLKPEMIAWGRNGMIYVAESEGGPNQ